jgi:uncharacterized phage-associated protein
MSVSLANDLVDLLFVCGGIHHDLMASAIKFIEIQGLSPIIICMATYSTSLVANAFLYKARQSGVQVSHMKLQKLVFFIHAWSLASTGASYVDERPEAWPYGPVFGSLYHELKSFGSRDIDSYLMQMNSETGERQALIPVFSDGAFWGLLDQVWNRYGSFSALQLSALTHESGGPWEQARQTHVGWLPDEVVRDYYRPQIQHVN